MGGWNFWDGFNFARLPREARVDATILQVQNEFMNELERWANFYLLMSAAAATLLGLMFVVIALAGERRWGDAAKIPFYLIPGDRRIEL